MEIEKFLNESQDPKTVDKILKKVSELLTKGETVDYIAVQKKPVVNLSPDCIALTNRRIIFCRPKNLGVSMSFQDILWKDVENCHIEEKILGSIFTVKSVKNKFIITLDYLPKAQARLLYRYAQEKEEEMERYRRHLELEKSRAQAGKININSARDTENNSYRQEKDPVESLKKLKRLLEEALISQEEFNKKKTEILSKL